ncbi:MAG: efflux RND transporter periplasmic adaptor subunit [Xanthomonadales bacterium]
MKPESAETERQRGSISLRMTLLICAALVLAGIAALTVIFNTEPEVQRESAVRETAMLVEVTTVEAGTFRPVIEAMGTVRPAREVTLRPRISGEVMALAGEFVPGGEVAQGEVLLRMDDADYRIALEQRQSELQQAIADLEIEHGRQQIAENDYRQLNKNLQPENRALVLREPQLKSAEAAVRAARAAVERAQLDLERTTVRAPFHAQVLSRDVNLGSQVSSGTALARLVGVDTYWVEATIPPERLRWLTFPGNGTEGSPVAIRHRTAWPEGQTRTGYLYRLVGELEGDTRMARVLVAVDDPLGRAAEADLPSLIIGSFVECRIHGRPITDVVRIPRDLVRKGDTVWVMRESRLAIQPVEVVFQDAEFAYVREGLRADDQVVVTSLATVKEGIPLRLKS